MKFNLKYICSVKAILNKLFFILMPFHHSEIGGPINIPLMALSQIASASKLLNSARVGITNVCSRMPCEPGIGFAPTLGQPLGNPQEVFS